MAEDKSGYEIALERIAAVRESMGTEKEIYDLDLSSLLLKEIPKEVNDLTILKSLNCAWNSITIIENLDNLLKLNSLDLQNNRITQILNLEMLTQLNLLNLKNNKIVRIENLDKLNNLVEIFLDHNQIERIENLTKHSNLRYLSLSYNFINKIENLEFLPNLNFLNLSINQISVIENLDELKYLDHINLSGNQISKIENLDSLNVLTIIFLNNNRIFKIEGLNGQYNLQFLNLESNQISRIENLKTLSNLKVIDLSNNQISKIVNLDSLINLTSLYLGNNRIKIIENLDKLISLENLYLEKNQISKIENIEKLTNLTQISIESNQISIIENIESLSNLTHLYLSTNQISKIINLDSLSNLIFLSLDGNKITKIENLDKLTKLQQLNLSENQIYKIENIEKLTNLQYLKIDRNKIENFSEISNEFIAQIKRQHLGVKINNNPFIGKDGISIEDYSSSFIANHSVQLITDYKYSTAEKTKVKIPAKLILYGNSNVGKSFFSHFLRTGKVLKHKKSTEILKIDYWNNNGVNAYIYDFGGQDFYHATYQMFFTTDTIYCVLWDDSTNQNKLNDETLGSTTDTFYNYNIAYWIANIKYYFSYLKNNSSNKKLNHKEYDSESIHINLVKNKIDIANNKNSQLSYYQALRDYPIDHSYELMLETTTDINFLRKRNFIKEELISQLMRFQNSIIMVAHKSRALEKILALREKHIFDSMTIEELWSQTYDDQYIDDDFTNLKSVLRTLHNRGLIIWYEHPSLSNKVWLRPDKVIKHIHSVLKSRGIGNFKGNIPNAEFERKFADLKELMLIQNIAFFDAFSANYVIPQFLSEQSNNDILFELAQDGLEILFAVQFKDFMPHGLFNRLACFFGGLPDQKYYVKNKMIFTLNSVKVWLEIDPIQMRVIFKAGNTKSKAAAELQMYLFRSLVAAYWGYNPMVFELYRYFFPKGHNTLRNNEKGNVVEAIFMDGSGNRLQLEHEDWASTQEEKNLIQNFKLNQNWQKIIEVYNDVESNFPSGMKVSLDNIFFAEYKELITVFENHKDHNNYLLLSNLVDKENSRKMYAAPFNSFMNKPLPVPKKLFISYSSKNSDFMKRFTLHLESLRTEGLISYWTDRMIDTGAAWDEKIQMELDQADRVIYLLCPYFLVTPYIMEKELSKGFKKEEDKPGSIQFIHLQHCNWKIHPKLTEYQHLLDPTIPEKKLVVVENAMNDEAWVKITEDLRNILKHKH